MSGNISDEIKRIQDAKLNIKAAINEKGGTITNELIDKYPDAIRGLTSGGGEEELLEVNSGCLQFKGFKTPGTFSIPSEINGQPIKKIADYLFYSVSDNPYEDKIYKIDNTLIIEEGIEEIGVYAFANSAIRRVVLPSSLKIIKSYAFYYCKMDGITLPKNIEIIRDRAFSDGSRGEFTKIVIPDTIKSIGTDAFTNCYINELILPDKTGVYYAERIFNVNKIKNLEIPGSISNISDYMFSNNPINELKINNGVEKISAGAFSGNKLKTLYIPDSVKYIGDIAFNSDTLQTVSIPSTCSYASRAFPSSAVITKREV